MERLDDGSPVWVVHHGDGEVSVLDPAVTSAGYPDGPPGLRFLTWWWGPERQFTGGGTVFDERGTALGLLSPGDVGGWTGEGTATDMARYVTEPAGDAVRVSTLEPGQTRSFAAPPATSPSGGQPERFDPAELGMQARSLAEALAQPDGTVSVVDSDLVDRDGHVRFCPLPGPSLEQVDDCPADAPVATTIDSEAARGFVVWFGPFLVRSENGALTDVVSIGGGHAGGGG